MNDHGPWPNTSDLCGVGIMIVLAAASLTANNDQELPLVRNSIRESTMDAARDLFYEQGVLGTSVRDIASRADVALSSVYAHFENKDALVLAVMLRSFDVVNSRVEEVFKSASEPSFGTLCTAFRVHSRQHMLVMKEAMLSNVGVGMVPEPMRQELQDMRKGYEERFQALAAQLADRGEIASSNLRVKVRMLLTAGIDIGRWFNERGPLSADAISDIYVDLCRSGFRN